jgi:hypothetical protein
MTSLVDISCCHCGVRTRTSYGWLATQPRLVCSGCFRDVPLAGLSSHPIDRRSASTSETALSVSSSLAMILWAMHAPSQQGLKSRIRPSGINFGYRTRRSPSAKRGALRQPALRSTSRRRPPVDISPACPCILSRPSLGWRSAVSGGLVSHAVSDVERRNAHPVKDDGPDCNLVLRRAPFGGRGRIRAAGSRGDLERPPVAA